MREANPDKAYLFYETGRLSYFIHYLQRCLTQTNLSVSESIEQAARILEAAYSLIILETDIKTLKVNNNIIKDIDYQASLKYLNKISIMCRRIEFELREHNDFKNESQY